MYFKSEFINSLIQQFSSTSVHLSPLMYNIFTIESGIFIVRHAYKYAHYHSYIQNSYTNIILHLVSFFYIQHSLLIHSWFYCAVVQLLLLRCCFDTPEKKDDAAIYFYFNIDLRTWKWKKSLRLGGWLVEWGKKWKFSRFYFMQCRNLWTEKQPLEIEVSPLILIFFSRGGWW